ncbi:hypothetical protein MAR_016573, partial [Mya arenaria]
KLFNLVTNIIIENGNASVFSPMIPAPGGCCPISESSAESRHETSTRRLKSPANPKRWPRKTFYCSSINREKARITIQVQRLEMCLPLPRHRI